MEESASKKEALDYDIARVDDTSNIIPYSCSSKVTQIISIENNYKTFPEDRLMMGKQ